VGQKQLAAQCAATQVVHVLQLAVVQHICAHWADGVPPMVQRW
jgi:hypothetical protein